ncbi:Mov34/MPN/PAD-1 family protein [Pseudomonas sp.]|uniref:CBASS system CD-NTase/cGAS isopeptidase Cap3 n=1 Tax=Pseudomonas sp. TaxID=306 RepID=UPI0026DC142E|nr:Mov34/MPN/PAD-1 family protein [Pseudomonas sp.]MDO4233745.1 Mov34/MPN/PAD-1 family protein [Pseudomonas sp.]
MIDTELTFTDKHGGLLVIMPTPLKKMLAYRQLGWFSTEAAGVLIGERRGPHLVVHEISEPGPGDIRRRCFVDRRGAHHQTVVDKAFISSSGMLQYLGEWHTHPEDSPSPSSMDLDTWQRHLISGHKKMALLIVGRKEIWAAKKDAQIITPLTEA